MENMLYPRMNRAFEEDTFLRKLRMTRSDAARLFGAADWNRLLAPCCRQGDVSPAPKRWRPSGRCWTPWRRSRTKAG